MYYVQILAHFHSTTTTLKIRDYYSVFTDEDYEI